MDNLFEILIPIIFFLVWIVSNLRKSFKKNKKPPTKAKKIPSYPESSVEIPAQEVPHRPFKDFHGVDIEKEIRRRIEERQSLKKKPQLSKIRSIPKAEMLTPLIVREESLSFPLEDQEPFKIEKSLSLGQKAFAHIPTAAQIKTADLRLPSKLHQMLHKEESLRSAVILSEILDKPIALRRYF